MDSRFRKGFLEEVQTHTERDGHGPKQGQEPPERGMG